MNITTKLDHLSSNFITQYLTALGVKDVNQYLYPNEQCFENIWNYTNIGLACETLKNHVNNQSKIGIICDSDQDGCCSASLIYNFLIRLKVNKDNITVFFHSGKQHGISDLIEDIINSDINLLLVPDAGTNDVKECKLLQNNSIDIIITDHHAILEYNPYAIVVNNQHEGINNKYLSGTGVADKFVRAYCEIFNIPYPHYEDLVAVSLVSDVCDLSNIENRAYIYFGLNHITNPFVDFLFKKLCKKRGYTPEAIGWDIGPLGNALARSNEQESKSVFFDGLIGQIKPDKALKELRRIKRLQDEKVKDIVGEIEPILDFSTKVILGYTQAENANFTGLIANKILGKYGKPVILLRDTGYGSLSGSLRSPVPLLTEINDSGLAKAQGHEEACGVFVKQDNIIQFQEWLETLNLSNTPNVEVTCAINPEDITLELCAEIEKQKELWGHGCPEPTFYIKTVLTQDDIFVFEKSFKTLKLEINGIDCIKFFATNEDINSFRKYDKFELELVVKNLTINEWEGIQTPQCIIDKYEIHLINETNESWEDCF